MRDLSLSLTEIPPPPPRLDLQAVLRLDDAPRVLEAGDDAKLDPSLKPARFQPSNPKARTALST